MPDVALIAVVAVAVFVGAVIQGGVGFGLGLMAAPNVTIVDPTLMPGSMLVLGATMPVLSLAREWRHTDWRGLAWAFLGRLPGTAIGVWIVATVPRTTLGVTVGVMVLVAVVITTRAVAIPRNRATLTVAGLLSGITGTATAIGGPPIALVYQHAKGPRIRATLAVFFCAGSLISMASLAAAGQLPTRAVIAGLALVPVMIMGFLVSGPVRRYLDGGRIRRAVLVAAGASAVLLIARSLWGA